MSYLVEMFDPDADATMTVLCRSDKELGLLMLHKKPKCEIWKITTVDTIVEDFKEVIQKDDSLEKGDIND